MKIDVFNHFVTPKFNEKRLKTAPPALSEIIAGRLKIIPALGDLEARFKIMDMFEDYVQILTLANPPLEILGDPRRRWSLPESATTSWPNWWPSTRIVLWLPLPPSL